MPATAVTVVPGTTTRRRTASYAALVTAAGLTILDVAKVGVILPVIQGSLGGSDAMVQIMVIGYTVAYAVTLLPAGRIGDQISRKGMFLLGCSVFVLASAICALATSDLAMVIGRVVQGLGAGLLMPQVLGLIQVSYVAAERLRPLAGLAMAMAVATAGAPVLAGLVVAASDDQGWRWLFWLNVIAGLVLVPIALLSLPAYAGTPRSRRFDWVGAALIVPGVALFVTPITMITARAGSIALILGLVGAGTALIVGFVLYERRLTRRGGDPLVDLRTFGYRQFSPAFVISAAMHACGTAGLLTATLFYEEFLGRTPLATALWMLPSVLAMVAGSWLAGRIPGRLVASSVMLGTTVNLIALVGLAVVAALVPAGAAPLVIAAVLFASSGSQSLVQAANQSQGLFYVPVERASGAGSMLQAAQRVGSAIGFSAALTAYYGLGATVVPGGQPSLGPAVAFATCAGAAAVAVAAAALSRGGGATVTDR